MVAGLVWKVQIKKITKLKKKKEIKEKLKNKYISKKFKFKIIKNYRTQKNLKKISSEIIETT